MWLKRRAAATRVLEFTYYKVGRKILVNILIDNIMHKFSKFLMKGSERFCSLIKSIGQ